MAEESVRYRVPQRLIRGLSQEQTVEFIEKIKNCHDVRTAMAALLTEHLNSAIIESERKEKLESPNYLGVQADLIGYRRGLREAISLLTLKEQPK